MSPGTVLDFGNDDGPSCQGLQMLAMAESQSGAKPTNAMVKTIT
jgi:hypothetical protein